MIATNLLVIANVKQLRTR